MHEDLDLDDDLAEDDEEDTALETCPRRVAGAEGVSQPVAC